MTPACPHTHINPHGGTDHCSPLCLDCGRLLPFEPQKRAEFERVLDELEASDPAAMGIIPLKQSEAPGDTSGDEAKFSRSVSGGLHRRPAKRRADADPEGSGSAANFQPTKRTGSQRITQQEPQG